MKNFSGNTCQVEPEIAQLEKEADKLLECIKPTLFSNAVRSKAAEFVRNVILTKLPNVVVAECGSTCFRTYLADSDLDLTVLVADNGDMHYLISIFTALCEEIYRSDNASSAPHSQFTIRNVDFINARTKLISCLINNIGVDITLNQASALDSLVFLERADRLIGNHLFKQSLMLIKCWCLNESYRHCGMKILGAKEGMLSSYALSVLVLHLFNKYCGLQHPFHVLHMFFFYYCNFPWDTHIQTLSGPVSIAAPSTPKSAYFDPQKFTLVPNRFSSLIPIMPRRDGRFIAKVCNIQDPVDEVNNLGVSVNNHTMAVIHSAIVSGYNTLTSLIQRKAMLGYGQVLPAHTNVPKSRSLSATGAPPLPTSLTCPPPPLEVAPTGAIASDIPGSVSAPVCTAGNTPRRAPSASSAAASPNLALAATDSAQHVPMLALPSPLVLEGVVEGKHGGGAMEESLSAAGLVLAPTMGPGPSYGFVNQALPSLLTDFFPVSLDKYSCGPSSSSPMTFARSDLWEHPLQRVRGMESLVYCSLLNSGAGEDGTPDVLESDVQKLHAILESVRSQRLRPRGASEVSRPVTTPATSAAVSSPSPRDARCDSAHPPCDAKRLVCEVAVQTEALPGSGGVGVGEEEGEGEGEGEGEEDRVSLSSQATTATSSSADLLAALSDASLPSHPCGGGQTVTASRSGGSGSSSGGPAGDLGESAHSHDCPLGERGSARRARKKAAAAVVAVARPRVGRKAAVDVAPQEHSASSGAVREDSNVASSSGLLPLGMAAVVTSSTGGSAAARGLPDGRSWPRLVPAKVLGPVLLLSSAVLCYLLRLHASGALSSMARFSSRGGASLSSLANFTLATPSSSASSAAETATATGTGTAGGSQAVETAVVTHWVLLGDSVTFGDFSSEPTLGDGLVGPLRQGLVQASYTVQPVSSPAPLTAGGSGGSGVGGEAKGGEGGGVGRDGLGTAAVLQYLWRKDNATLAMTSTPHYTLSRSELADAGHYACYRVAGLRLLADGTVAEGTKVVDTIIRISKKPRVLNRPSYQEVKARRPLIIKLDFEAIPAPSFRWFRNGYHLPAQTTSELYIGETSTADSGTYSCEVRNIAGGYLWLEATVVVTE